jgi:hypothetical protein
VVSPVKSSLRNIYLHQNFINEGTIGALPMLLAVRKGLALQVDHNHNFELDKNKMPFYSPVISPVSI